MAELAVSSVTQVLQHFHWVATPKIQGGPKRGTLNFNLR